MVPPSPPCSLNCREIPPPHTPKYAKHARIPRLFVVKPDCRERTARNEGRHYSGFSPEAHAQSGFEEGTRRMRCDQRLGVR